MVCVCALSDFTYIYLAPPIQSTKRTHTQSSSSVNELSFPTNFPPHKLLPFQKGAKFIGHHNLMLRIRLKPKKSRQKGREGIVSSGSVCDNSKENNDEAINRIECPAQAIRK